MYYLQRHCEPYTVTQITAVIAEDCSHPIFSVSNTSEQTEWKRLFSGQRRTDNPACARGASESTGSASAVGIETLRTVPEPVESILNTPPSSLMRSRIPVKPTPTLVPFFWKRSRVSAGMPLP